MLNGLVISYVPELTPTFIVRYDFVFERNLNHCHVFKPMKASFSLEGLVSVVTLNLKLKLIPQLLLLKPSPLCALGACGLKFCCYVKFQAIPRQFLFE